MKNQEKGEEGEGEFEPGPRLFRSDHPRAKQGMRRLATLDRERERERERERGPRCAKPVPVKCSAGRRVRAPLAAAAAAGRRRTGGPFPRSKQSNPQPVKFSSGQILKPAKFSAGQRLSRPAAERRAVRARLMLLGAD